jgi:hypothetical protein
MTQRIDQRLIDKAVDRLSEFPGQGSKMSRRETLQSMVTGLIAGVMAPTVLGLGAEATANAQSTVGTTAVNEQLIIAYYQGMGTFSADTTIINLIMTAYDLEGNMIGTQQGVHQSLSSVYELFSFNVTAEKPYNAPPVPIQPLTEWTKGLWSFNDGSAVYAAGPAHSRIVPLTDGSWLFTVTTAQIITSGIGKYANAYGVKQATGSAFVPAALVSTGHFPLPGLQFQANTIEVFRIFTPSS